MTKLEFINKLIKERKESKDRFILSFERYLNDEVVIRCIKDREQEIQILEQIKTNLEAWEIVADEIFYGVGRCLINSSVWFGEEAETIKKALEVEDE